MDRKKITMAEKFIGIAVTFSNVVGFIALLVAIAAFLSNEYAGAGLSLIAAALAFRMVSVSILRA